MSYPGPPGVSSNASHASLPPRPPATNTSGGFRSTFSPSTSAAPTYPASAPYSSAATYNTPPVAAAHYGAAPSTYSYPQAPPVGAGRGAYGQAAASYNYPTSYSQQPSYYGAATTTSYSTPPQIRNPFPQPGTAAQPQAASQNPFDRSDPNYDPEMAAQIAQWQSAYLPKEGVDANAATASKAATGKPGTVVGPTFNAEAAAKAAQEVADNNGGEKKKTVYREGGGKKWADDSLLEWDPSHLRLFVGNLAGETTDDSLLKAFARWQSVQKAKVVRDKRTNKSKGYGFVSFSDSDDFFQAAKEMNGKYIQSHPVVVRKSTTEIKPAATKDKNKNRYQKKGGNKGGHGGGSGAGKGEGGYSPHLGPTGGGIVKPGQKNKSGVKFLG
ncbi:hypothetical protein VSDG_06444 [Cytospora chrysosperma]|uniref:RRM domain-containing protein n=1 Tax=Cytospora chrysosperma TaxID=252740 RepID=A0A423VLK9_CYTCH|nr:hypothetical protein VSDG_06444 [Valsa sordida]